MAIDSDLAALQELKNLRDAAAHSLSESLSDPAAQSALLAGFDGDVSKSAKVAEVYDSFAALVTESTNDVIATWCEKNGLASKIAAAAKSRAVFEHGGNAATPAEAEKAYREALLTQKRAKLARITDSIREEDTASANMRVELEQQKGVVGGLVNKIRMRGNAMDSTVKTAEEQSLNMGMK